MSDPGLGTRRRVVLIVEDDDTAYFLIRSGLRDLGSGLELQHVENAEEALRFLRKVNAYERPKTPWLVIIDEKLPMRDGWWLLSEMRKDVTLRSIFVVVVGREPASDHGPKALASGAQYYIEKSADRDAFVQQVKEACLFALELKKWDS